MKYLIFTCLLAVLQPNLFAQDHGGGRISGEAFIDYYYNISRDTANYRLPNAVVKGDKDFNAFEFRRITFTYDYDFSSKFQSRVRFEGNQSSAKESTVNVFVKDLFLKWKNIFEGSDLILGIQPPPSFEVSESYWQFRSLEKTIMDLRGIAASRDMGISLKGKFDKSGVLGYWITAANNSNLGPEVDKYKRVYAHLNIAPIDNMNITLYGDYKFRSKLTEVNNIGQTIATLNNDVITCAAFVGIKNEDFSIGVETVLQITRNGFAASGSNKTTFSNQNAYGISVFGNYMVFENVSILGRFDYFDPNSKLSYDSRNFFIAGLSFLADKKIKIIPNVLVETYEKNKNTAYSPSVTGRLTVHFVY